MLLYFHRPGFFQNFLSTFKKNTCATLKITSTQKIVKSETWFVMSQNNKHAIQWILLYLLLVLIPGILGLVVWDPLNKTCNLSLDVDIS